jgi:hypothetical protein
MAERKTRRSALPDLPRAVALLVLAGLSAFVVWSFHAAEWPGFLAALVIGGVLGFLAGGLVGVHLPPTLATMLVFGGLFEGVYWGWQCGGWAGAVLGGPVGVLGGVLGVCLALECLPSQPNRGLSTKGATAAPACRAALSAARNRSRNSSLVRRRRGSYA